MKWAFAGTPIFAERILSALLSAGYVPEYVLTQPDRPAGRGMRLTASPVKQRALEAHVPILQPERLKDQPQVVQQLSDADLDVFIVVAYGLIIPPAILKLPRWGCWNVHASLLPRWRGAAPIHRAIQAGDTETGVGIMQMEVGLDTGPVYETLRTPIYPEDTTATLHDRLAELGAEALLHTLAHAQSDTLPLPVPQTAEGVCYAEKIKPDEARLDWTQPAEVLERQIRAFNPNPGAWTCYDNERLKIWAADVVQNRQHVSSTAQVPGMITMDSDVPEVVCGANTCLRLRVVQPAGSQRVDASVWSRRRQLVEFN